MKIFERIQRAFVGDPGDPTMMDHIPVNGRPSDQPEPKTVALGEGLTHRAKLELAAARHGKPFKDAADGLPRLVTKDGADVTVGVRPKPLPEPPPKVTTIGRKAAR